MLLKRTTILVVTTTFISLLVINFNALAQSYRYMDEAGNIHFVDSAGDIPYRYKNQVPGLVKPEPVLSPKEQRQKEREIAKQIKEKERAKEKERKKREKELKKLQDQQKKEERKRAKNKKYEVQMAPSDPAGEEFGNTKPVEEVSPSQ